MSGRGNSRKPKKKIIVSDLIRKEANKIIDKEGDIDMPDLIGRVADKLGSRGFKIRKDLAQVCITSMENIEVRVIRNKKKIRVKD